MTEQELLQAAQTGDVSSIEAYAIHLFMNSRYFDCQEWSLKGAQGGSYECMEIYATVTVALINSTPCTSDADAAGFITDLKTAEHWALTAMNADKLSNRDVLYGSDGIYASMMWYHCTLAMHTDDSAHYESISKLYQKLSTPYPAKASFAYIGYLAEKERYAEANSMSLTLLREHENDLPLDARITLYTLLGESYFEGRGIQANYQKSHEYMMKINEELPDNPEMRADFRELHDYYASGQAKEDFMRRISRTMDQPLENIVGSALKNAAVNTTGKLSAANQNGRRSRMIALLLAFFLGSGGIHDFYLGYTKKGILKIVLTCFTSVGGIIWALIDFVHLLNGTLHTDANGNELMQ